MRFSNAATLLSVASLANAAPAVHGHQHMHAARQLPGFDEGYPAIPPTGHGGHHARQLPSEGYPAIPPIAPVAPPTDSPIGFPAVPPQSASRKGFQTGTFFVNWAIYARKFMVTDLPAEQLTKINYAFANINNRTGEIMLSDEWADVQFPYPGDVATNGSQLLGNFNQLYKLKMKNRNLKVVISVGGWSFRNNFKPALATDAGRKKFCESSIQLVGDLGLDGIDIDYEYPEDKKAAHNLAKTVKYCRQVFDKYSAKYYNGYRFAIGISSPAGPQNYEIFPLAEIDQYVDNYNLMAFDYMGPGFSNFTGHLSNVYPSRNNPRSTNGWNVKTNSFTPFNTERAIAYYKTKIADASKIQLGMPLYGRGFANVVDPNPAGNGMGMVFNGSTAGSWEAGVIDYKQLPKGNATLYSDWDVRGAWTYDRVAKEVISFDTPQVAVWKTQYVKEQGLGGAWFWESSGDRPITDPKSLTRTVVENLGGVANFQQDRNNLYYPRSKYYNIRNAAAVA